MSHAATAWAFGVRGLRPAEKLVLLALADCHNPAFGCFPSQEYIASVCEISRRSVNYHLAALEARGLIERRQGVDPRTRRQVATIYRLGFELGGRSAASPPDGPSPRRDAASAPVDNAPKEDDSVCKTAQEPCAKTSRSRVQNLHTNLVKEPVKESVTREAGPAAFLADPGGIAIGGRRVRGGGGFRQVLDALTRGPAAAALACGARR